MSDWRTRMDALKRARLAAGKPTQIGRGSRIPSSGTAAPFDTERDMLEYPPKWLPDEADVRRLPEPLRTWAVRTAKDRKPIKPKQASTRTRHSVNERRQAVARHAAGESYAAIARHISVRRNTVVNWCRRGV